MKLKHITILVFSRYLKNNNHDDKILSFANMMAFLGGKRSVQHKVIFPIQILPKYLDIVSSIIPYKLLISKVTLLFTSNSYKWWGGWS